MIVVKKSIIEVFYVVFDQQHCISVRQRMLCLRGSHVHRLCLNTTIGAHFSERNVSRISPGRVKGMEGVQMAAFNRSASTQFQRSWLLAKLVRFPRRFSTAAVSRFVFACMNFTIREMLSVILLVYGILFDECFFLEISRCRSVAGMDPVYSRLHPRSLVSIPSAGPFVMT